MLVDEYGASFSIFKFRINLEILERWAYLVFVHVCTIGSSGSNFSVKAQGIDKENAKMAEGDQPEAPQMPKMDLSMFLPMALIFGWRKLDLDVSEGSDGLMAVRCFFVAVQVAAVLVNL